MITTLTIRDIEFLDLLPQLFKFVKLTVLSGFKTPLVELAKILLLFLVPLQILKFLPVTQSEPTLPVQPTQDPESVEDEIFWFCLGSVVEEEELGDSKKMKAENNLDLLIVSELGLEVPSKIAPGPMDLFADPISDEGHSHFQDSGFIFICK